MANQPRANNPSRNVRVEDDLWHAAQDAAAYLDVSVSDEVRAALRTLVVRAATARAAAARQEPAPLP